MKARDVEQVLRDRGMERGTQYVLSYLVERMGQLEKAIVMCAQQQSQMIDTMANVVEGAGAMKSEFERQMKRTGLEEPEDDLGDGTQNIQ